MLKLLAGIPTAGYRIAAFIFNGELLLVKVIPLKPLSIILGSEFI
jgi:hypothetical protein